MKKDSHKATKQQRPQSKTHTKTPRHEEHEEDHDELAVLRQARDASLDELWSIMVSLSNHDLPMIARLSRVEQETGTRNPISRRDRVSNPAPRGDVIPRSAGDEESVPPGWLISCPDAPWTGFGAWESLCVLCGSFTFEARFTQSNQATRATKKITLNWPCFVSSRLLKSSYGFL
jgi:hypothetical protein